MGKLTADWKQRMPPAIRFGILYPRVCFPNIGSFKYKELQFCLLCYMSVKLCLSLWKEHRLRVFENMVLRKIFGCKWDEVTGDWGRRHNDELYNL